MVELFVASAPENPQNVLFAILSTFGRMQGVNPLCRFETCASVTAQIYRNA